MIPFLETFPLVTTLLVPAETSGLTGGDLPTVSTTTIETVTARAPMVQINWRSTDLAATSTSVPSSSTGYTAGPTAAASEERSGALPVASIIGITLGCVVALLVACATGSFLRRRKRTKVQARTETCNKDRSGHSQPLHQDHKTPALAELEQPRQLVQVDGTRCVAEMEATSSESVLVGQR